MRKFLQGLPSAVIRRRNRRLAQRVLWDRNGVWAIVRRALPDEQAAAFIDQHRQGLRKILIATNRSQMWFSFAHPLSVFGPVLFLFGILSASTLERYGISFNAAMAGTVLPPLNVIFVRRRWIGRRLGWAILASLVIGSVLAVLLSMFSDVIRSPLPRTADYTEPLREIGLGLLVGLVVFAGTFFGLASVVASLYYTQRQRRWPVHELIDEISIVGQLYREDNWTDVLYRQQAVAALGRAARAVEVHLGSYPLASGSNRAWTREQSFRIAWNFRELQKWVITSRQGTDNELAAVMTKITAASLRFDFDGLQVLAAEAAPTFRPFRQAITIIRRFSAGLAPLTAVLVLREFDMLPGGVEGPALLITSVLAVLVFLNAIDPTSLGLIGNVRETWSMLGRSDGPGPN